jgi:hypothetical protein
MPASWQRLMVSKWRSEFRTWKPGLPSPTQSPNGNGEASWKKLRAMDDKIKALEIQITGFEATQPELAERLESDLKKLRAERKTLADE